MQLKELESRCCGKAGEQALEGRWAILVYGVLFQEPNLAYTVKCVPNQCAEGNQEVTSVLLRCTNPSGEQGLCESLGFIQHDPWSELHQGSHLLPSAEVRSCSDATLTVLSVLAVVVCYLLTAWLLFLVLDPSSQATFCQCWLGTAIICHLGFVRLCLKSRSCLFTSTFCTYAALYA